MVIFQFANCKRLPEGISLVKSHQSVSDTKNGGFVKMEVLPNHPKLDHVSIESHGFGPTIFDTVVPPKLQVGFNSPFSRYIPPLKA